MTNSYQKRVRRLKINDLPEEDRPIYRIKHVGPESMATTELLAIIIGTGEALSLAEELVVEFGSLAGIARQSLERLEQFDGIGPTSAAKIKAAAQLAVRIFRPTEIKPRISSPGDAYLSVAEMALLDQEQLRVICVNTRNEIIKIETLYQGNANTSIVRVAEIMKVAIDARAVGIILAHNHPSGDPSPSPEDVRVTRQIKQAADLLDFDLLDHIIVGAGGRYVSLKERGLGFD